MKYLLAITLMCLSQLSFAGSVYKCQTASGMAYQSSPCAKGAKKVAAACNQNKGYGYGQSGQVNFNGESCEDKKIAANKVMETTKINKRDAFIKATTPKVYKSSFDDCLSNIDHVGSLADGKVIDIISTSILKTTKFCSKYSSAIITCSRPDERMVVTLTSNNSGCS